MNYRILEMELSNGDVVYAVEKEMYKDQWESVYRSKDLEKAKEVYFERKEKANRQIVNTKVLDL